MLAGLGQLTFYLKHTYLGRLNYYSTQLDLRCTDHIRYEGREILFIFSSENRALHSGYQGKLLAVCISRMGILEWF